jgi:hypothetical protein
MRANVDLAVVLSDPGAAIVREIRETEGRIGQQEAILGQAAPKAGDGILAHLTAGWGTDEQLRTLRELKERHQALTEQLYQGAREWTFAETDSAIVSFLRQLHGMFRQSLDDLQGEFSLQLIRLCKILQALENMQAKRRELLPAYLSEARSWDTHKLKAEVRKCQRDIADLPAIFTEQGKGVYLLPVVSPFVEQRRFLEDLIIEFEATLGRGTDPKPTRDDVQEEINRIRQLVKTNVGVKVACEEMKQQYSAEHHAFIDREFRKILDGLRERS